MLEVQEDSLRKNVSCCNVDEIAQLTELTKEIIGNNEKVNKHNQ